MPSWQKGQSGNPKGSSEAARFRAALKKTLLSKKQATDKDPQLNRLIQRAYDVAMKGRIDMIEFLKFVSVIMDGEALPAALTATKESRVYLVGGEVTKNEEIQSVSQTVRLETGDGGTDNQS
jgi:hypothetical protein